jgi:carboxypeptidase family protein
VGTITGTVSDATGAVVPSATITITNKATSVVRTLTANAEGLYSAPALVPGDYEVRAEMQGFRTLLRDAQVTAGSTTTVDMSMTLGTTREVVTVEAATAQINYDSHTVAGVIARESIQDIPLNGRSSLQLASLEPSVTVNPGATSQFNAMFNVSILGSNGGATAGSGVGPLITMDGGVINDEVEGGTSMNFSQEVVQEFQIQSVNFDAATGIAAGGAVNIVTRSGSNDFHGSAYFYFRDHNMAAYPGLKRSAFNPNPFFARRNPGAWLGGPVIKDKFFFFFSYEHLNQTSVITEQNDIPSLQPLNSIWPSPLHYNWLTARFDYRLSDKHTFFARFSHDGNADFGPYAGTGAPSAWIHNSNWSDQSIIGLTSVITPVVVNDLRAQYHFWENRDPTRPRLSASFPASVRVCRVSSR